ncbi:MAG: RAMP superfamily CRISPR-associated protein [Thermodesulfovibrio sp.]
MIHDYYLKEAKEFADTELARKKKEILNKIKDDKNINDFYPKPEDLQKLPQNSVLIKIFFTLKRPYTSKDEGEFHIIDGRIFENPIVRDKFTGLPMVRPSTWKGHLRFAADKVEWNDENEKKKIIRRLFGSEPGDVDALKGRLYFFPTFFKDEEGKDVITPLDRKTRTPVKDKAPISIEVMKPGKSGEFYLLYVPYPKGKDFKENEIEEDLKFLAKALDLMFSTYGFSAKKTSGFGMIERLEENEIEVCPRDRKDIFSILYTKQNKTVKDGA